MLPTEDGFEIGPFSLHCNQELECLSDLCNVVLPEVNFIIELLVIWRTLLIAEHNNVIFNDTIYVISTGNLVVFFEVCLALELLNFEVCLWSLFPNSADFLELNFNF